MKHIKYFKLFESSDRFDVVKEIKDILIPMEQLGYQVIISDKSFPSIQGKVQVKREVIKIDVTWGQRKSDINVDIVDMLYQLLSYARGEGFHCNDEPYGDIKINIDNTRIVYTLKDLESLQVDYKNGKIYTIEIKLFRNV